MHPRFALCLALLSSACSEGGPIEIVARAPEIRAASAAASPFNVLSAFVTAEVAYADSVSVQYATTGGIPDVTPAVVPNGGTAVIPMLGLQPASAYTLRVLAHGESVVQGDLLHLATGELPADLPAFVAGGSDPSPGFVVISAGGYGLVLDNSGRVVWYRHFAEGIGLNFQALANGRYAARPQAAQSHWVEIDVLGAVSRTVDCAGARTPRFHDVLVRPDGSWWLMCDETRTLDLSSVGGIAGAHVTGTVVQRIGRDGELLFQWSPFDHFTIEDLRPEARAGALVNWTHGNAIDFDGAGNLLISFRELNEITKVDPVTGAVLWRMGGIANQFTFIDTSLPAFAGQHSVRVTGPDRILMLDNIGNPLASRAERYVIDEAARTVRLEQAYASAPSVVALLGGTAQNLPGGRTLVSFGSAGRVEEYDAEGRVVWRLENPGYVFRAQRITSLYRPGVGSAR